MKPTLGSALEETWVQSHVLSESGGIRPIVASAIFMFFAFWAVAIFYAARLDGTLELPEDGRGLLVHYGFMACLLSAPLVLVTTYLAISQFFRILGQLDEIVRPGTESETINSIVGPHVRSLALHSRWVLMLVFLIFIGIAVSLTIFKELDEPTEFWGNEVFNAEKHPYGYWTANSFLLLLWGLIYPIGIFFGVHLTMSAELIVAGLRKRELLQLDFLHTDRCGGMAKFGTLNFVTMLIYFWPLCVAGTLHYTHSATYLSLLIGGVAISVGFILQSVYGIHWVSRSISSERANIVKHLNIKIQRTIDGGKGGFTAATTNLAYRDRVMSVTSMPYSGSISSAVNFLRFAPAVLSIANAWAELAAI